MNKHRFLLSFEIRDLKWKMWFGIGKTGLIAASTLFFLWASDRLNIEKNIWIVEQTDWVKCVVLINQSEGSHCSSEYMTVVKNIYNSLFRHWLTIDFEIDNTRFENHIKTDSLSLSKSNFLQFLLNMP